MYPHCKIINININEKFLIFQVGTLAPSTGASMCKPMHSEVKLKVFFGSYF